MEILNKNGETLLDYRKEFKRHYADSIDDALKRAILTLYKEKKISEKLFRIILNENVDDLEVYAYLITQKEYTKSSDELNYEFDKVRQKVNDYLISCNFIDNVSTKNSLNDNKICIIRQYDVGKELLLSFFGLTQTEIIPLMKRKGFMDKFCVLRLNQIFKEIYSELKVPEHVDHGYSLVYYNKLIQGFSIDYKYYVNINYLLDENNLVNILDKIKELDKIVEKKFQNKLNYAYYSKAAKPVKNIEKTNFISPDSQVKITPVILTEPELNKNNKNIKNPNIIVNEEKAKNEQEISNETIIKNNDKNNKSENVENKQTKKEENQTQQNNKNKNKKKNTENKQSSNNNNEVQDIKNNESEQQNRTQNNKQKEDIIDNITINIPDIEIDEDDKDLL